MKSHGLIIAAFIVAALAILSTATLLSFPRTNSATEAPAAFDTATPPLIISQDVPADPAARRYVGPRQNIPADAPTDYDPANFTGFWSFSIPADNVLSRSGQPTTEDLRWLASKGWNSIVDLRPDDEYGEISDDSQLPGFDSLDLAYLHLPITDGGIPTDEQAETFLAFVTEPTNQPAHVHCRAGIGRAGLMTALYRYSVEGWTMEEAIEKEASLYSGGPNVIQKAWLYAWATRHEPGGYATGRP